MRPADSDSFQTDLRRLRKEAGLTQTALASLTGISHFTISRYENGSQEPTIHHRASLAEVFGAPGYHIFDRDYISGDYTPDVTIRAQERIRLAMAMDDYEYVESVAHRIQAGALPEHKRLAMIQIKDYLKTWCFFRQGADAEYLLSQMTECIRLTLPAFSPDDITVDTIPERPLSYMEIQIINAIGVALVQLRQYNRAAHVFGMLIRETDSDMQPHERRIFRKVTLALNLALTLRKQGSSQNARSLLEIYTNDSVIMSSIPICLMLLVGTYKCMDHHSEAFRKKRHHANMFLCILTQEFGFKKSLDQLECEIDGGLMLL